MSNEQEQATAAYNFVPLGPKVVPAPFVRGQEESGADWQGLDKEDQQEAFAAYVREQGCNSGWIDLDIETLTPLLVGGAGDNGQFFAPLDPQHPVLPGSSLRGMTRNLVKIMAAGAMRPDEDFEDKKLYFRVIAARGGDKRKLHYDQLIQEAEGGSRPGFLMQLKDGSYCISPGRETPQPSLPAGDNLPKIEWSRHSATVIGGPMKNHRSCATIEPIDWQERYPVPPELLADYRGDPMHAITGWARKNKAIDLLDEPGWRYPGDLYELTQCEDICSVVPCHYVLDQKQEQVISFGHGRKYRIPYECSISDHVQPGLRDGAEALPDLGDAIFGVADLWAGRVNFADGCLQGTPHYEAGCLPRPQLTPKPTAYQLYLEQGTQGGAAARHWDSRGTSIRGYKFYWHQQADWRKQTEFPEKDHGIAGSVELRPLKQARFQSKVYFQDLSDIELGALCAALGLGRQGGNAAYKIGRGKALGMGSVRLRPTLHLLDEKAQYEHFLTDKHLSHQEHEGKSWQEYVQAFTDYRDQLLGSAAAAFKDSMQQLRQIMDYDIAGTADSRKAENWEQQVATMPVGDRNDRRFSQHIVLPDIRTVVAQAKKTGGKS